MSLEQPVIGQSLVKRHHYCDYNGRIRYVKRTLTVNAIYPNKSLELLLQLTVRDAHNNVKIDDTFCYIWNPMTGKTVAPDPRDAHKSIIVFLESFITSKA